MNADEINTGEVVVMIPKAELDQLRADVERLSRAGYLCERRVVELREERDQARAHDKEATDLTIDQQVEIGRLRMALGQFANSDNWEHEYEGEAAWLWLGYQAPFESAAIALGYPPRKP